MDPVRSMDINPRSVASVRGHNHLKTKILFFGFSFFIILGYLFGEQLYVALKVKGYQAVFLSNNQVYFGKLSISGRFYRLTDIYYLQATQSLQQTGSTDQSASASEPNMRLLKLGSELHGPEDAMYIEKDKVLFWENMKADAKVVDAINKYKQGKWQK